MNFRILFILFLINNLLHFINEKVIIIIFIVIFYYLLKILSNIIETEYQSKIEAIGNDIENYLISVFNILKYYRNFFRKLIEFKEDFHFIFKNIINKSLKSLFNLKLNKNINIITKNIILISNIIK